MVSLRGLDLRLEGMVLEVDGRLAGSGTGIEALGDPVAVVAWMANTMARFGRGLEAGMVIITGSIVQGAIVEPGQTASILRGSLMADSFLYQVDSGTCFLV